MPSLRRVDPKRLAQFNILLAILFAAMILLTSAFVSQHQPTLMYILVTLWFVASSAMNAWAARQ